MTKTKNYEINMNKMDNVTGGKEIWWCSELERQTIVGRVEKTTIWNRIRVRKTCKATRCSFGIDS